VALNLGMATRLKVETPLMWIDKKQTWELAEQSGGEALVDLIRFDTHTCYLGERGARTTGAWLRHLPGVRLRARGYEQFVASKGNNADLQAASR
jgi:7-cyano-7-deazaguanine synthase